MFARHNWHVKGRPVVLLLSGGVDSTTTGAILREAGYALYALSFDYGQRHKIELRSCIESAKLLKVAQHKTVHIDLRAFGGSALTDNIGVPKGRDAREDIPVTYVPARNTLFLSFALGWAEVLGARDIAIGVTAVDYSGYPDCRPEFIKAFEELANLGTKVGIEGGRFNVHTPLINMTKVEILREGLRLGVDYGKTHSCYDPGPSGEPCCECDSCLIRARAFLELGISDPVLTAST